MIAKACLLKSTASYPMLEDEMKTHFKVTIRVGTMQVEGVMFFFGFWRFCSFLVLFFFAVGTETTPHQQEQQHHQKAYDFSRLQTSYQ
jgi:hypothetical protein